MRQRMSSAAMCGALVLSGLLSLALACGGATSPDLPFSAKPLAAPAKFALWWRLTQSCSGLTGDYASVSWYVEPNTTTISWQGQQVDAYWMSNPDRIVLSDAHRDDGPTVRHEMLHALRHSDGHPRDAFLTACGGVVACDGACALETGSYAPPQTSSPVLQPSEVAPRVDVFTAQPTEIVGGNGAVATMFTITNPRAEPVWVQLAQRQSGDLQFPTFGLVVDYNDPARVASLSVLWSQDNRFALGAGESRHWVWEGTLPSGNYGVLGYFNVDTLARRIVTVGQ